jgi:carboxylesterase
MTDPIIKTIKKVKSVLFADPKLLYKEERHLVNQPFYFQGGNSKAVLLIHGWSSVPYEVRRLGVYLNENGYTVSGPLLSGHGTVPKDLENVKWEDWLADVEKAYRELRANHENVYFAGTSIGGNLAVMLAAKHPEIAGVILMATPYKIRLEKTSLLFSKLLKKMCRYNKKFYPPTFGVSTTLTRIISYQTYPVASALEAFRLVKDSREYFPLINQPSYLLQSSSDHIAASGNLEMIYDKIKSTIKKKRYIKRAYHTFISDIKNENVFEDILNFLNEN